MIGRRAYEYGPMNLGPFKCEVFGAIGGPHFGFVGDLVRVLRVGLHRPELVAVRDPGGKSGDRSAGLYAVNYCLLLAGNWNSMKCSELMRKLQRDGWFVVRQRGSHVLMEHPTKQGQVVVPDHGSKELASGTARSIIKKAGL